MILRFSCVKAFTPTHTLTPVPCRSDVGCDKIDAMPRRHDARFGQGTGQDKAKSRGADGWLGATAPEMALLSSQNRLQFQESSKPHDAVRWPGWLPCAMPWEKVLSVGAVVALFFHSQRPSHTAK